MFNADDLSSLPALGAIKPSFMREQLLATHLATFLLSPERSGCFTVSNGGHLMGSQAFFYKVLCSRQHCGPAPQLPPDQHSSQYQPDRPAPDGDQATHASVSSMEAIIFSEGASSSGHPTYQPSPGWYFTAILHQSLPHQTCSC